MSELHVGGLSLAFEDAKETVRKYLHSPDGSTYAFPYYDRLETTSDSNMLSDGDFLAPVLLNAPVTLGAFRSLVEVRGQLEAMLRETPADRQLADASAEELDQVAGLFAVLDDPEVETSGVRGSVLSKVMHRKRPGLIPLYDSKVRHVYRDMPGAPIERDRNRSWVQFMRLLVSSMQQDLRRSAEQWSELSEGLVTPLRALDIVTWSKSDTATNEDPALDDG
ncbi:MAG: hypothetical protein FJW86_12830 [Actinobacteria bacterium]|nr:hypothetical protein [Actinomycetota bacterium]